MNMKRSYITLSPEVVERDRMARSQALPGFPYISHKGAQTCLMAYAMKIISRDNVMSALYFGGNRMEKSMVDMSNKTIRDIANKGYLERFQIDYEIGNLHALGDLGFEYLGVDVYRTDFERKDLLRFYQVNRVFNHLCKKYRKNHAVEWVTDPEDGIGDARSIIWKDRPGGDKLEESIWLTLESNFSRDQVEEVLEKQKKFVSADVSVYVVNWRSEEFTLKIVEDGEECVDKDKVVQWVERW